METIKIKRDGPRGWRIINAADFDPAKHEKYEDPKPKPKARRAKGQ